MEGGPREQPYSQPSEHGYSQTDAEEPNLPAEDDQGAQNCKGKGVGEDVPEVVVDERGQDQAAESDDLPGIDPELGQPVA